MATYFRVKISEIGLITYIHHLGFQKSRISQFRFSKGSLPIIWLHHIKIW